MFGEKVLTGVPTFGLPELLSWIAIEPTAPLNLPDGETRNGKGGREVFVGGLSVVGVLSTHVGNVRAFDLFGMCESTEGKGVVEFLLQ